MSKYNTGGGKAEEYFYLNFFTFTHILPSELMSKKHATDCRASILIQIIPLAIFANQRENGGYRKSRNMSREV